jgi:hypothetical protein
LSIQKLIENSKKIIAQQHQVLNNPTRVRDCFGIASIIVASAFYLTT